MNSRERLTAATRSGPMDRAPWFAWSERFADLTTFARRWEPDAIVAHTPDEARRCLLELGDDGPAVLVMVEGLYGRIGLGPLVDMIDRSEEIELAVINAYDEAVVEIEAAAAVADGVLYILRGVTPDETTPMQFGGLFLERERELLESVRDARFNVLRVQGGEGVYLDFVSDLPAHAISWEYEGLAPTEVRDMFSGALACCLFGEHERIWEDLGGTGLIFAGPVDDLATHDFARVRADVMRLGSTVNHG